MTERKTKFSKVPDSELTEEQRQKLLTVCVGSTRRNWQTKELEAGSNYTCIRTYTDDIESVKQALNLMGIEVWYIKKGDAFGEEVEASPLVNKTRQAEEEARNKYDKQMTELCKELNSLPRIVKTWYFGGIKVVLVRPDKAEYVPSYSSKLRGTFGIEIYIGENQVEDNFWLTEYITEDGKIQRKKFYNNLRRHGLEEYAKADFDGIEEFVNNLKQIKEVKDQYRRKYRTH